MTSKPMFFPPAPFDLGDAVTCSTLVDIAYDMYAQCSRAAHRVEPSRFDPHDPDR